MDLIFFDTESAGFTGPTILIQYALGNGDIKLWDIWKQPVYKTLKLIRWMMEYEGGIVGYNLAHDMFHLVRTYNCLSLLPQKSLPDPLDYMDIEDTIEAHDSYCLKPVKALDLMLHGRKGEFQSTFKRKDIILRRIPKVLAHELVEELKERVKIPDIYFSKSKKGYHWRIIPLHQESMDEMNPEAIAKGDPENKDFVNIRLKFSPSTALKAIIENVFGIEVTEHKDLLPLPKVEEHSYYPSSGKWIDTINHHIEAWTNDSARRRYAKDDVIYTRKVYEYFGSPDLGDTDSTLACAVGAMYWHGFEIDIKKMERRIYELDKVILPMESKVNVNSHRQVREYLWEYCSPMEKLVLNNTSKKTLHEVLKWESRNPDLVGRVKEVLEVRRSLKEKDVFQKLIYAKRMYVNFKVIGAKSNRMGGGSDVSKGGSINPQGIKKGPDVRSSFPLATVGFNLDGGDFSGFETTIADALWCDPQLRADLQAGYKIHGLFGAIFYEMTYDEIMETEKINHEDENGYYKRSKNGVFAFMYGAEELKMAETLRLTVEEVRVSIQKLEKKYTGIRKAREAIFADHKAMRQEGGIGTRIVWTEPKKYCESFLGFKRYFTMEYEVMKALYDLANNIPDSLKDLGKRIRLRRRERIQTASGAACSAIYGAAFSLQGQIMRAAGNHAIQSPGGQITKEVQVGIWNIQPSGISEWRVMPLNIHDEIESPTKPEYSERVKNKVNEVVESFRDRVPLIEMEWKQNIKDWSAV